MSVLVRDPNDNKIKLYIKGADNVILERLEQTPRARLEFTNNFVDKSSVRGYRTLLMAMKILDDSELQTLLKKYEQADNTMTNR